MTPGNSVTVRWMGTGLAPSLVVVVWVSVGSTVLPRISRCRSSPPSLLSTSDTDPSSKVSAKVLSASDVRGSSELRRCRDEGEEARDRNEGGGEDGMEWKSSLARGVEGSSSWSLFDTWQILDVRIRDLEASNGVWGGCWGGGRRTAS